MILCFRKPIAIIILFNNVFPITWYGTCKLNLLEVQIVFLVKGIPFFKSIISVNQVH